MGRVGKKQTANVLQCGDRNMQCCKGRDQEGGKLLLKFSKRVLTTIFFVNDLDTENA